MGMVGISILLVKHAKKSEHLKKINLQVLHAKNAFAPNQVYGSWIMKQDLTNNYVGAINVLENNQIIDHYFKIDQNYKFKWIPSIAED
jgi:hypothetical protein